MRAPIRIAHVHVQSMRLASGEEALVARALTKAGTVGFGFSFDLDATAARHMASWDAAAKERGVPLWKLLSEEDAAAALSATPGALAEHPWERARRAIVAAAGKHSETARNSQAAGSGIEWSSEPTFATLKWLPSSDAARPDGVPESA